MPGVALRSLLPGCRLRRGSGAAVQAVFNDYPQLANVVILVSLPIAGCTLAASVAAGLADRGAQERMTGSAAAATGSH